MANAEFAIRDSTFCIPLSPPLVMGILNVTPDSFSDGGEYLCESAAVERALGMIDEGADILDVGPESTRPGSQPVAAAEQIRRAVPIIGAVRKRNQQVFLSIDTRLSGVAEAAIDAGADLVNDVSALRDDPRMGEVVAERGVAVVLMHRRGTAAEMQTGGGPKYDDVIGEIGTFLGERRDFALRSSISRQRIILDPGIGFGKRVEHNLTILGHLHRFTSLGQPLLIGASRKSFLGAVLGIEEPKARDAASLACAAMAVMNGASIIRTHDVRSTVEVVRLVTAVRGR